MTKHNKIQIAAIVKKILGCLVGVVVLFSNFSQCSFIKYLDFSSLRCYEIMKSSESLRKVQGI